MAALKACQQGNNSSYLLAMEEWFVPMRSMPIIPCIYQVLKLAILTSCHVPFHAASHVACLRIDGPFAQTGPGTWGWDRRMFQELFGLFTNSATVDNVVERLGQVRALPSCPPPPSLVFHLVTIH